MLSGRSCPEVLAGFYTEDEHSPYGPVLCPVLLMSIRPKPERKPMTIMPQTSVSTKSDALSGFYEIVREDINAVRCLVLQQIDSSVGLIEQIGQYALNSSGKRMRPLLVLLTARCCGYQGDQHIKLAAAIECLHTATLLHDDVIDESILRRGQITTNKRWGRSASVLLGDYLYSKAFHLLVEIDETRIMRIIAEATNVIVEGEIMQLANLGNTGINEQDYREIIRRKTAMLFQASTHSAAALAEVDADVESRLKDFGLHFGLIYQLVDDALDYSGSTGELGKNIGDDLSEGKLTLPLIYVLTQGTAEQKRIVELALKCQDRTYLSDVIKAAEVSGGLKYTQDAAALECQHAQHCLTGLEDNVYRDTLEKVARYALERQY